MSSTNTSTFTVTNAAYLASKIAADLQQMKAFYGEPSDSRIDNYIQELVILLKGGYLHSVEYGFKKNNLWVLALSYTVNPSTGQVDNNPGRVPLGKDISGATFGSFLSYSSKFEELPSGERKNIVQSIAISRGDGNDPQIGLLAFPDKTYASGGQQVNRKIIGG